jgi:hypothetical protein
LGRGDIDPAGARDLASPVMSKHPVVVYGASGYTGRLICEYLRELHLPFTAAGRDKDRVQEVMDRYVPGIDTIEHDVVAVEHTTEALSELFEGSQVVLNCVGPFAAYGHETVQACLNAGTHYSDTTGEQNWILSAEEKYGDQFAEKGLLLAPGIAQMYTTGEIAAQIALETAPGMDTLDILVLWKGFPTYASTQTIFTTLKADAFYLENDEYVKWPADTFNQVSVPGQHLPAFTTPWGGTSHPVWFKKDGRVSTCKVYGGVFDKTVMEGVKQIVEVVETQVKTLPTIEEQDKALSEIAAGMQAGMPPRENQRVNRSLDSVWASGPLGAVNCLIQGASNYKQTGLLQAYAAHQLIHGGRPKAVGLASACQAFGHHQLLGVLQQFGLVGTPQISGLAR